jgi:serine/threonine protein kinase
LAARN